MKFLCLMPVWNHRTETIENAIQCFLDQRYKDATLVICDDRPKESQIQGILTEATTQSILFVPASERIESLPKKYNQMLAASSHIDWDAVAIWDDDDGFTPMHLQLANDLYESDTSIKWTYPDTILADYRGLNQIPSEGRFWSSITVSRELLESIGGFEETRQCGHDQLFLRKVSDAVPPGRPSIPTYVYRWGNNGENHCSGYSQGVSDESWWNKTPHSHTGRPIVPAYDIHYLETLSEIRRRFPASLGI